MRVEVGVMLALLEAVIVEVACLSLEVNRPRQTHTRTYARIHTHATQINKTDGGVGGDRDNDSSS